MKSVSILSKENAAKIIFGICAAFSIFAVFAIILFVLYQSIPAFRAVGVLNFLFGSTWLPGWEDRVPEGGAEYSQIFGIAPIVAEFLIPDATIAAALGAISTLAWVSGVCYLLLWFVSIFWAFPIKHRIRQLNRQVRA